MGTFTREFQGILNIKLDAAPSYIFRLVPAPYARLCLEGVCAVHFRRLEEESGFRLPAENLCKGRTGRGHLPVWWVIYRLQGIPNI